MSCGCAESGEPMIRLCPAGRSSASAEPWGSVAAASPSSTAAPASSAGRISEFMARQ